MAKTYVVAPNYTTRPPPSLQHTTRTQTTEPGGGAEPSENFATTTGTLFLGDVIREPLGTEIKVINRNDRLEIPRGLLALPPDVKKGFRATRQSLLKGRVGVWATFLAALGLPFGVDVGLALERNSNDTISAEEMETQEMEIDDAFVKKVMDLKSVKGYLEGCSDPPPALYIVTGLKIVRGASAKFEAATDFKVSTGATLPSQNTFKVLELIKDRSEGQEFDWSAPFVLAFRARKILYKRGKWEHSLFTKGASMMTSNRVPKSRKIEVDGIGEDVVPDTELHENYETVSQEDGHGCLEWIVLEV